MHKFFADWYREIDPNPDADKLKLMWNATVALAKEELSKDQRLAMVRLALTENADTEEIEAHMTAHFKKHDPSFPARNNRHALKVLSAISLIYCVEEEIGEWYLVALAAICGSWQKDYEFDVQVDLLRAAKQQVVNMAVAERKSALRPGPTLRTAETNEAIKSLKDITFEPVGVNRADLAQSNLETFKDTLMPVLDTLSAALKGVASLPSKQQRVQEVLTEENNVLWWVFAEYSRDLDKSSADVHKDAWTLHAASELVELTTMLPAHNNMRAVLSKSLLLRDKSKENVALDACINACERGWRQVLVDKPSVANFEIFVPVLTAVKVSLQLDESGDWTPIFAKATGLTATAQVSRLDLAWQTYQELLLARVYHDE